MPMDGAGRTSNSSGGGSGSLSGSSVRRGGRLGWTKDKMFVISSRKYSCESVKIGPFVTEKHTETQKYTITHTQLLTHTHTQLHIHNYIQSEQAGDLAGRKNKLGSILGNSHHALLASRHQQPVKEER